MNPLLKLGIVVTTLGWVAVGITLTVRYGPHAGVGPIEIAFGWACALGGQAGLLVSPFASRVTTRTRIVMFVMLVPGLLFLIANTVDGLDGHKSYFRPLSLLTYASLAVWCAAGHHVLRPNRPMQRLGLRTAVDRPNR